MHVQEGDIAAQGRVNRMQAGLRRRRGGARAQNEDSDDDDAPQRGGRARRRGGRNRPQDEEDEGGEGDGADAEQPKAGARRDAYEARRAAKDAEREAAEAAQEAEIRLAAEERARREEEEAQQWMHTFTVEDAGEEALSQEQGEELLNSMVEYLQTRKTVALEELAAEYGIRTADAVSKVQSLEAEGRITGVMDDRGKFIYVSREEMAAVADFIRKRGRVAIGELAAKSASFIDLESKEGVLAGAAAQDLLAELAGQT